MGTRAEALKLAGIAAFWLAAGRVLPELLWRALPDFVVNSLSLPGYSMLCQVLTTLAGLGVARLAFRHPAAEIGVNRPTGWHLASAALLAPLVFVSASFIAIKIAEPYLIAEIAKEGAGVTRKNAGAFGKAITEAPLLITLVWGAVFAAITEELAFRGALFAAIERGTVALLARPQSPDKRTEWLSGLLAVVLTAAAFGAMHADMKGSVGIVRVASATCLGLACGAARLLAKTVFASLVLHFIYNSISLGLGRGLFRGDSDPLLSVVPNRLLVMAAVGLFLALAISLARRAARSEP